MSEKTTFSYIHQAKNSRFSFSLQPTALVLWALSRYSDGLCIFSSLHFSDSRLNLLDDFDFDFDEMGVKTSNSLLHYNL